MDRWKKLKLQLQRATADDRCTFCRFCVDGNKYSLLEDTTMPEEDRQNVPNAIRFGVAFGCSFYARS
jgi:hypothetical protein